MIDLMLAAVLLQGVADPCQAAETAETLRDGCPQWRFMRANDVGRGYIDPASVRRDGDIIEIMTRTVAIRAIAGGVRSFTVRLRIDCAARTALPLHYVGYDAVGVQVYERRETERVVNPAPGSVFEVLLGEYCRTGQS